LPFEDETYDLALSFFVLEHIENIEWLFQEIYRILKQDWQFIIWHFLQRREFVWKKNKEMFKIELFNHRIQDLEDVAKKCFFTVDIFPIKEKWSTIWFIISLKKD
jgi:ubiquinone/menaquinone biosynthesis C-methylase UbiE